MFGFEFDFGFLCVADCSLINDDDKVIEVKRATAPRAPKSFGLVTYLSPIPLQTNIVVCYLFIHCYFVLALTITFSLWLLICWKTKSIRWNANVLIAVYCCDRVYLKANQSISTVKTNNFCFCFRRCYANLYSYEFRLQVLLYLWARCNEISQRQV